MGYAISHFLPEVQTYIKENNVDKNTDGIINKDNGELQNLLSNMKTSRVEDSLAYSSKQKDYKSAAIVLGTNTALAGLLIAQAKFTKYPFKRWLTKISDMKQCDLSEAKNIIRTQLLPHKYEVPILAGGMIAIGLGLAAYFILKKPENV